MPANTMRAARGPRTTRRLIGAVMVVALLCVPADASALQSATKTILTSSPSDQIPVGAQVVFTAYTEESSSQARVTGGTTSFTSNGTPIAGCGAASQGLDGATCTTSFSTPGVYAIQADYSGASGLAASSGTATEGVYVAPVTYATATSVSAHPNPAGIGAQVTYEAAVTSNGGGVPPSTGTVSFTDGSTTIAGCDAVPVDAGKADCSKVYAAAGSAQVTAAYSGAQGYLKSSSSPFTESIIRSRTATDVWSSPGTVIVGQPITLNAIVTNSDTGETPGGTVSFATSAGTIPGCGAVAMSNGGATCSTTFATAGSPQFTATYSGSTNIAASSSAPYTVNVLQTATTTTALRSSTNPAVINKTVTYTATVGGATGATPTGTVAFTNGTSAIAGCGAVALNAAGVATCATMFTAAGTPQITASYSGATHFATSTSTVLNQSVLASAVTTTTSLIASFNPAVVGQRVTYTATVTSSSGAAVGAGTVAFTSGATTIAGCGAVAVNRTATCSLVYQQTGSRQITATYTGGGSFAGSTSPTLGEQVAPAPTTYACQRSPFSFSFVGGTSIGRSGAYTAETPPPSSVPAFQSATGADTGLVYSLGLNGQGVAPDLYGCERPFSYQGRLMGAYPFFPVNMVLTGYSWNGGFDSPMTFTGIVSPATEALLMANATKSLTLQFAIQGPDPGTPGLPGIDVLLSGTTPAADWLPAPGQPGTPALGATTLQSPTLVSKTTTITGQPVDVVKFTAPAPAIVKGQGHLPQVTYAPCPTYADYKANPNGICGYTWILQWGKYVAATVGSLLPHRHASRGHGLEVRFAGGSRDRTGVLVTVRAGGSAVPGISVELHRNGKLVAASRRVRATRKRRALVLHRSSGGSFPAGRYSLIVRRGHKIIAHRQVRLRV